MKDLVRKAYRVGTGEDVLAPPDSGDRSTRLAFDGKSAALIILVLSILGGLVVGWTASRPVEVHALQSTQTEGETEATEPVEPAENEGGDQAEPAGDDNGQLTGDDQTPETEEEQTTEPPGLVTVYVSGQVKEPGLVEVPEGSRVALAVEKVGGMTSEADLNALNLARVLVDGEHIVVPAPGETVPVTETPDNTVERPADPQATPTVVDLNTAGVAELETLPGVGPAIAQRIIDWRELNGQFTSVDELMEVSGIGPATLQRLRDLVTV